LQFQKEGQGRKFITKRWQSHRRTRGEAAGKPRFIRAGRQISRWSLSRRSTFFGQRHETSACKRPKLCEWQAFWLGLLLERDWNENGRSDHKFKTELVNREAGWELQRLLTL